MSHPDLSVLIAAAGASHRLGQPKQLVHHKSGTLIQNVVDIAHSLTPLEIIVVTGANAEAVKGAVQRVPVRWVHNPLWSSGLGRSIAAGATAISPVASGVMVLLCDQWQLQASDLQKLAHTWQADRGRIVCAQSEGHNMPPVIFPACLFMRLKALDSEKGAHSVLGENPAMITAVPLANAGFDLDTKTHFDQLRKSEL